MNSIGGSEDTAGGVAGLSGNEHVQRVSYLDKTLWNKLAAAASPAELAGYWLELQCWMIEGVARAALFLPSEDTGAITPAAFWPGRGGDGPTSLLATAKRAITEQKGVVSGHRSDGPRVGQLCCTAYPFVIDGVPRGAVAVEISDRGKEELRVVMRQLQWGAAWIELALRRSHNLEADHTLLKSGTALDLIGLLLEEPGYAAACKAAVTELATAVDCDLVALGFSSTRRVKVAALSHSAEFGRQMNLVRSVAAAMEEAVDQESAVVFPAGEGADYRVTLDHEELSRLLEGASILTIPLLCENKPIGALMFERAHGRAFDQDTVDLCDAVAAVAGPILEQKRRDDRLILFKVWDSLATQVKRLFGAEFLGRKIAFGATVLLVAIFSFLEDTYRVAAPAKIEGHVQRVIVAPFDGYIATQAARAGDRVRQGAVLATLDNRDLILEHVRWTTTRSQRLAEYDQMVAAHDRPGINIVKAQIEQADAHIALLAEQLKRTELVAAFDGLVVSGDLSQSIGAAVSRGEELFEIAPLDSYRVTLEVDETQVLQIEPGQTGRLKVAALLDETLPYTITQVTPITESRDGRNFFRVEAELTDSNARLRPGMEGIAKTDAGTRLVIRNWTEDLLNWLRLKLWAWWP